MPTNPFVHFEFPHRMNKDGTTDSICPRCFATVGRSTWEADLDRMEATHICDPARLTAFNQHRRMPVVADRLVASALESNDRIERAPMPVRSTRPHRTLPSRRSA